MSGAQAAARLAAAGTVAIDTGLGDDDIAGVEAEFGFEFADDHREFLAAGLPVGPGWPNWRAGGRKGLAALLRLPTDGIVFAVEWSGFWDDNWGPRPAQTRHAVRSAAYHLARVPVMVPLHTHHFLPAGRGTSGHPVLSVYRSDIGVVGAHLEDHIERLVRGTTDVPPSGVPTVAFWSDHVR